MNLEQGIASLRQRYAHGVRADGFVKAVAWCDAPETKEAMLRLFQRTADPDIVAAVSRSVGSDHPELVCDALLG